MAKPTTAGGKKKVFRKKERKNIPIGIVYIAASFNNTLISITDLEGNLIAQSSSGARGFRGSRKGTPFAAQQAAYEAARRAMEAGVQQCEVRVRGPVAVANPRFERLTMRGFALPRFVIKRLSRTMDVDRRSDVECNHCRLP